MDLNRLHAIIRATTYEFRRGRVFEGTPELVAQAEAGAEQLVGAGTLEIFAMPHVSEAPDSVQLVDMVFLEVGVDVDGARAIRGELVGILNDWGWPDEGALEKGPSYIAVGARIGDQGAALRLFALGKILGLWGIITPESMGFEGAEARDFAGRGFLMIDGFRP
jgi:hypothetical protein